MNAGENMEEFSSWITEVCIVLIDPSGSSSAGGLKSSFSIPGECRQRREHRARVEARRAADLVVRHDSSNSSTSRNNHRPLGAETTTGISTLAFPLLTVILAEPGPKAFTTLLGSTVTTLGLSEV